MIALRNANKYIIEKIYRQCIVSIELTMWLAGWQPTPTMADVTVTKIAGYVRVRILMNQ